MVKLTAQEILDKIIEVIKIELESSLKDETSSSEFILGKNEAFLKILKTISDD
jgi:hypothetical protein|tara:strand:- start:7446 stop:7604 length:159 start_codon:yes stop_codon:yes gene_type:complete